MIVIGETVGRLDTPCMTPLFRAGYPASGGGAGPRRTTMRANGRLMAVGASLLGLALLAGAPSGAQATAVGDTERVVDEVRGSLGTVVRQLEVPDQVFTEETIDTGDEGATRIVFLDGTELVMGPRSRVTLDRFVYDPATQDGAMSLNFVSGLFEFASGLIPSSGYDLRTPFANLAIRGTVILVMVEEAAQRITLAAPQGAVRIFDAAAPGGYLEIADDKSCVVWQLGRGEPQPLDECGALIEAVQRPQSRLDTGF
jgi:hypothetical protein